MLRKSIVAALLVAVVAVLVAAAPARARAQSGLPAGVTASAEFGGRTFSQNLNAQQLGKFEEYRDMPSGALLSALFLRYSPDSFRVYQLTARNVGQLDQSLGVQVKEPGAFDFQFRWDGIPHTFSTTARILGSRPTPDYFSLAGAPRTDTAAINNALNAIQPSGYLGAVRTRWQPLKAAFTWMPSDALDSHIEYTRVAKSGDRPMGMAFGSPGNNAREILEPIDQTTHDLKVSQAFTAANYQLLFSYNLSLFQNAYTTVSSDNPLQTSNTATAGAAAGRTALAPDNVAHTMAATGGLTLPAHTRLTSTFSYAWWLQNAAFVPMTTNSALAGDPRLQNLPTSLNGRAGTKVVNLTADSRPIRELSFSARYRYYDFRDQTDVAGIAYATVNDRSIAAPDTMGRDPFTRSTADVSATWRVVHPVSLIAGYGWERLDLHNDMLRNISQYTERTPRISLLVSGNRWMSFRTTYLRATRRNTGYDVQDFIDGFQRFDIDNRDRERTTMMTTITPLDALSFSTTWTVGHDSYPDATYGVQSDRSGAIGGDIAWTPNDRFSIGGGWNREEYKDRMLIKYRTGAQPNNPTFDYVSTNTDLATVTSANMGVVLVPGVLDGNIDFQMSHSRFRMWAMNPQTPTGGTETERTNATAYDFPLITQNLQPLGISLRYLFTTDWAATVRFQSELYDLNDFRLLGAKPAWWNQMFLGNQFQNYNASFLTLMLTFKPGTIAAGRSTL